MFRALMVTFCRAMVRRVQPGVSGTDSPFLVCLGSMPRASLTDLPEHAVITRRIGGGN